MSTAEWVVRRIGTVTSGRTEAIDDDWGEVTATITLEPPFDARALAGLDGFSHVEVVFLFDQVDPDAVCETARHPRRIGLSTCELVAVDGASIVVRGLDAIDGTPVLDVKPYMLEFGPRDEVRQPVWSHELMRGYW